MSCDIEAGRICPDLGGGRSDLRLKDCTQGLTPTMSGVVSVHVACIYCVALCRVIRLFSFWDSSGCIDIDELVFTEGDGDGDPRFSRIDVGNAVAEPLLAGGFVGEGFVNAAQGLTSGWMSL